MSGLIFPASPEGEKINVPSGGAYPVGTAFDYFLTRDEPFKANGGGAFMDGDVNQTAKDGKEEWLTPPAIVKALGSFDLDPCAPIASRRPWPTAKNHFTIEDNGLRKEWAGRVWLNPPYGRKTRTWMMRLAEHGDGIALIYARTDTAIFADAVWHRATAIFFLQGRITFLNCDGTPSRFNGGAPSCFVAYGRENAHRLSSAGFKGRFIWLNE